MDKKLFCCVSPFLIFHIILNVEGKDPDRGFFCCALPLLIFLFILAIGVNNISKKKKIINSG